MHHKKDIFFIPLLKVVFEVFLRSSFNPAESRFCLSILKWSVRTEMGAFKLVCAHTPNESDGRAYAQKGTKTQMYKNQKIIGKSE
jgi:hypothetical protein